MHFGISSYSFTWAVGVSGQEQPASPMTAFELVKEARQLGATRLQLADNLPVDQLSADDWKKLLTEAAAAGIELELGIRGLLPDLLSTYLSLSRDCGAFFLRVVVDRGDFRPDLDQIIEIIQQILPEFRRAGIILAIENHDRLPAAELVQIIEATDPDWVGICLDTANSLGAGEGLREVTLQLAPYTVNLHYKDFRISRLSHQMGLVVNGAPAGEGQIPALWLLDLLREKSRCGSLTLEIWSPPLEDLAATIARERQWVQQSAVYLRELLASTYNPSNALIQDT
jgi:sugar phosphate isomerase/epimerase